MPATLLAQSGGGSFSITHSSIDPAVSDLSGGAFRLHATVGQPATVPANGDSFELTGGFNAVGNGDGIFRNGFEP